MFLINILYIDMNMKNLLLVVGGPGSSGASTIAKHLAEHFNLEREYSGGIFREVVASQGYKTLEDFYIQNKDNNEKFFEIDEKVDSFMLERAKKGNVLIDSKAFAGLATINNISCTAKIWLDCNLHTKIMRFLGKQGDLSFFRKIFLYVKTAFDLARRKRKDGQRFKELYGIDYSRPDLYNDIILDTTNLNVRETVDLILKKLRDGGFITE